MGRVAAAQDVFRALADPTRRRLIDMLSGGPLPAGTLRQPFSISQPALSQHLQVLLQAGLVTRDRAGRRQSYRLHRDRLQPLLEWARGHDHAGRADGGPNGSTEPRVVEVVAPPAAAGAHNLPSRAAAFVGRGAELAELGDLLASCRLLTLTGPSGVGKTRLAAELAGRVAGRYSDGAWWLDLTTVGDPAVLLPVVAAGLSVRPRPGRSVEECVLDSLRHRRLLLLLDNCERSLEACARLSAAILESCPGAHLLATSHGPLGTAGEVVWPVPSLQVPAPDADPQTLAAAESVALFCERAAAVRRDFSLTAASGPVVAEICRRLDGIPLAIELAAARVGVITTGEILTRLDDRFALLGATGEASPDRHHTLQAALEWTHQLLPRQERALFRRLSVFSGGFTLEAAQAVCRLQAHRDDDVLDPLAALVSKSLVSADTTGEVARYRMLETVRLFGADRLERAGETTAIRVRHALWCLELAESAEKALAGPDQRAWMDRLEREHDNLRLGLAWSTAAGDGETALRLSAALTLFWRVRGHFREGRTWLEAALRHGADVDPRTRARALQGLGFLALMLDDQPVAVGRLDEALAIQREIGDRQGQARSLLLLGNARSLQRRVEARPLLEESVSLAREASDTWCLGHALAMLALASDDRQTLHRLLAECLRTARDGGELQSLRLGLYISGNLARASGDHRGAQTLLGEALDVSRQLGEPYDIAAGLQGLGELAIERADVELARSLLEEALTFARRSGRPFSIADALCGLGALARCSGDLESARVVLEEAARVIDEAGTPIASIPLGLGELAADEGDRGRARELLEEALRLAQARGEGMITARAISGLAQLSRREGDLAAATSGHLEALLIRAGHRRGAALAESLEEVAGVAAEAGRSTDAARLLGAAQSMRDREGLARPRSRAAGHAADLALLRRRLGAEAFRLAQEQGGAMSVAEAVAYANRGRGRRDRAQHGWASLTRAERGIAALVAEGLTNAQIGERLFISSSTVEGHLSHIFGKLGIDSRSQLVRETVRRETRSG